MIREKDIKFNQVTDENSGIVDACNGLIDEVNAYHEEKEELINKIVELEQLNKELTQRLHSKKRDYQEFSQTQAFQSFSLVKSPGSNLPLKKLKENKENNPPKSKERQAMAPIEFNLYTPTNRKK